MAPGILTPTCDPEDLMNASSNKAYVEIQSLSQGTVQNSVKM